MQPLGHMLVAHYAMSRVLPGLLSAYPSHVYSGSVGPDWFYSLQGEFACYHKVADTIHCFGTKKIYLTMLDVLKGMREDETLGKKADRCFEAARAFSHGFISHIAADCVYHPYVNRRADNPWAGDQKGAVAHAGVEEVIDNFLWPKYGNFDVRVDCSDTDNPRLLDYPVRQIFMNGLSEAYADQAWFLDLLQATKDSYREDHPINLAFRTVRQWAAMTEGLESATVYNINDIIQRRKTRSSANVNEETALNLSRQTWCEASGNEILRASAEDLFDLALAAATDAIKIGERYVNGEINSFENCGCPFLEKDYNIDTGLPSDENPVLYSLQGEARFSVDIPLLADNYRSYRK